MRLQLESDRVRLPRIIKQHFTQDRHKWTALYEGRPDFDSRRYQGRARAALQMLNDLHTPGGRLLDIGTGAGIQAATAHELGWTTVGMDLTHAMLRHATTLPGPTWVVGAAEAPPFRDSAFDVVMMLGLIGYVVDAEQTLVAARDCLRPGGHLIVSWATRDSLLDLASRATTYVPRKLARIARRSLFSGGRTNDSCQPRDFYSDYNKRWAGNEFDELLQDAGFSLLKETVIDFGRLRPFGLQLWPEGVDIRISQALEVLARWELMQPLRRRAMVHVVLAQKIP